ncbi:hypothetical protein SDC9_82035 [bioreactor metagenome]|uniref:Uncharacterized protein n=1 Tax=bioreactor metagenome TaxID=1076179 RepID=A0A644Z9Q6_9ZZZZ
MFADDLQALDRNLAAGTALGVEEIGMSLLVVASYPSPQLVELTEPIQVCSVYDDGVDIGDVDAVLNDGSGYQHLDSLMDEPAHRVFQLCAVHLAVGTFNDDITKQLGELEDHLIQALDAVVQKEYLPTPAHLVPDGFHDGLFVVLPDMRLDRAPGNGWGRKQRHIPDLEQRHIERSGYGGCTE